MEVRVTVESRWNFQQIVQKYLILGTFFVSLKKKYHHATGHLNNPVFFWYSIYLIGRSPKAAEVKQLAQDVVLVLRWLTEINLHWFEEKLLDNAW